MLLSAGPSGATRRRGPSTGPLVLLIQMSWPTVPTEPDFDLCGHVSPSRRSPPPRSQNHRVCTLGGRVFPSWGFPRIVSHSVSLQRRGENALPRLKTRVSEKFLKIGRSFLCTGAVKTNFLHRRGGFAKLCKTITPVHENGSPAKLSKTHEKTAGLGKNRRTPRAVWPLFFRFAPRRPPQAKNVYSSPSPAPFRAPPGHPPDPSRTAPGPLPDLSRTPFGRLLETVCALRRRLYAQTLRLRIIQCAVRDGGEPRIIYIYIYRERERLLGSPA